MFYYPLIASVLFASYLAVRLFTVLSQHGNLMTSQAYLSIPVSPLLLFLFALLTSILDYLFLHLL